MAAPSGDFTRHDVKHYFTKDVVFDGAATFSSNPLLALSAAVELTIASGAVAKTASKSHFTIDTESDAASDDLDSITGGSSGDVLFVHPASAARTVVLKHAVGANKIACPDARDISLAEGTDWAILVNDGTQWVVLAFNTLATSGGGTGSALASTANAKGASLVGIEDSASLLTGANVETAIAELAKYECITLADPGDGQAIPVTRSATVAITTAAAETNTLAIPTFVGQKLFLICDTHAVGDRVVTSAQAINQTGNTIMTFGAAGDAILLQAATVGGALRWRVVANDGVALSGP